MHQLSRDHALNLQNQHLFFFLTGTCRSTLKHYVVIAHLGKKFAIKALQILQIYQFANVNCASVEKRHRAQRKLRKR